MTSVELPVLDRPSRDVELAIHRLYQKLAVCESLRPTAEVDALFQELVGIVVDTPCACAARVMADPIVQALQPRLHDLCARGEFELESAWAQRVVAHAAPRSELARFPYYENYRKLSRLERCGIESVSDRPTRVAFAGAGPLPLSVLLLAEDTGATVDGIDRDEQAIVHARRLAEAVGSQGVRFLQGDIEHHQDLDGYDLVVLAALVGTTPVAKRRIVQRLGRRMAPGALLVVRSAHAMRTLLYPPLPVEDFAPFDLLTVIHPYSEVINSVAIARLPDRRIG